jgi:hypothetical protein
MAGELATPLPRDAIAQPRRSDDDLLFLGEGLVGRPCSKRVFCDLLLALENRKVGFGILTGVIEKESCSPSFSILTAR